MARVFLSHSSYDKQFVEPIADLLGKSNCIYDKYTFELGTKTIEEIFESMEISDLFVYFISDQSLNSKWVHEELNKAQELLQKSNNKLSQIFPIIIDPKISHSDERIANFLRMDYNLQRVDNHILAYRKIVQQLSKNNFEQNNLSGKTKDNFYGRNEEILKFKKRIDNITPIKSAVISGIPGIGKKSFIRQALIDAKIIKPYYRPIVLSLPKNSCIDDLIVSISDAGFGSYTLKDIVRIVNMDEKINILTELINKIQDYREIVIIEDDETIVTLNGDIKYWFSNAIKNSKNGISIILTSSVNVERAPQKNYPDFFFLNLSELELSDSLGLLRSYADNLDLNLTQNERLHFKDCLTGYPPQIIFCVDMIKNEGIDYAKEHTYDINTMPEQISSTILEKCQQLCEEKYLDGILSVVSKLQIAPVNLINKILKIDSRYKDALNALKRYSVCYNVGANGEYYKMNSFIENFVTRNRIKLPNDIQKLLQSELEDFNNDIDNDSELEKWDFSELKYYIKSNLKNGINCSSSFLYSTIILQTITELYNERKYRQVIQLIKTTQNNDRFEYFDKSIVCSMQRYLCQALIKVHDKEFEAEVEFFGDEALWTDYYFLKGFWNRCIGNYENSKKYLNKVLEYTPNHFASKRELVIVYLSLQDYESALTLSKSNYLRRKDNLFDLQAYFECLLELKELDDVQQKHIEEMLVSLKRIHRVRATPVYFQLLGKYEAYYNKNKKLGLEYIEQGLQKYPDHMYLTRDLFDIYRRYRDIKGMASAIEKLSKIVVGYEYKGVLHTRQAILDLYRGTPTEAVRIQLREEGFSETSINNVIKKVHTT